MREADHEARISEAKAEVNFWSQVAERVKED